MQAATAKMEHSYSPLHLLAICFGLASTAGVAGLLRGNRQLTARLVAATFFWNGLSGLVISLILYNAFEGKYPYLIIGTSLLAGMGFIDMVGFTLLVTNAIQKTLTAPKDKP